MTVWTLEKVGGAAGAVVAIVGVVTLLGFSVAPPWAKAEDITGLQSQIDELKTGFGKITDRQETQDKRQLRIQRVQIAQQLREALEDLHLNPNSISAARAVEDARTALAEIDRALAAPSP